ncbi:hypothetical protein E2C01_021833 [Portunus trituberculatus]|uniref:Uncharacterized protein n=1 Tax=Portunus trituberculatus TaxID=210409 RepID=A0A5B7E5P4_PORTR|nr:hypothetical protein [Portunus trituberculatus]
MKPGPRTLPGHAGLKSAMRVMRTAFLIPENNCGGLSFMCLSAATHVPHPSLELMCMSYFYCCSLISS